MSGERLLSAMSDAADMWCFLQLKGDRSSLESFYEDLEITRLAMLRHLDDEIIQQLDDL